MLSFAGIYLKWETKWSYCNVFSLHLIWKMTHDLFGLMWFLPINTNEDNASQCSCLMRLWKMFTFWEVIHSGQLSENTYDLWALNIWVCVMKWCLVRQLKIKVQHRGIIRSETVNWLCYIQAIELGKILLSFWTLISSSMKWERRSYFVKLYWKKSTD